MSENSQLKGALAGNPFELLKVRMQGRDYAYRNVWDGLVQVSRQEGVWTLWNGSSAAIVRSSLFCASQLATYDHAKTLLRRHFAMEDGVSLRFYAAMASGLVTTTVTTPADFVKSVSMNSKNKEGPVAVFLRILRRDAGIGFFKGWFANYIRLGPHTLITMFSFEALRQLAGLDTL